MAQVTLNVKMEDVLERPDRVREAIYRFFDLTYPAERDYIIRAVRDLTTIC